MAISTTSFSFKKLKSLADWRLLLFLVLFLNVKMAVKIPAIALIYLLQFNLKFGFALKNSRLPLFYLLAMAIAVLNWLISFHYFNLNYDIVLATGIGFWMLCILAMHQVKLFVEQNDTETIHRTIVVFFIINAILSLCNIALIIIETGYLNPYSYQGQYQKYFIGTGDYIRGITFDTSTTNAVLNALGCIYFLSKKNAAMLGVCMAVMLLTASNFTNIVLLVCFAVLFIFKSTRDQKSLITVCVMLLVVFMVKISPQNYIYAHEMVKNTIQQNAILPVAPATPPAVILKPDPEKIRDRTARQYIDSMYVVNLQSAKSVVQTIAPETDGSRINIPKPNINSLPYQHRADTNQYQKRLLAFIGTHKGGLPISARDDDKQKLPGKVTSWLQTMHFLLQHPLKLITGDGAGNFSSKLAFRASGLGFAGGYPAKYVYLNTDFLSNHLDVYLHYFSKNTALHSLGNSPDSVYDQLLGEYGLLGILTFFIWYIGYFLKHYKVLSYGLPILLMVMALFFIAYWFEQLSVIVFFELLLLLNIKENSIKKLSANEY